MGDVLTVRQKFINPGVRVSLTCLGENALLVSDLEQNVDSRGPEKQ